MHKFKMYIEFFLFLVMLNKYVMGDITFRRLENEDPDENAIETNPKERYELETIKTEISDLKELMKQQITYLRILLTWHEKLEAENSKWLKRYKSTRRYLRKMNRSHQCKDSKEDPLNVIKLHSHQLSTTYNEHNVFGESRETSDPNAMEQEDHSGAEANDQENATKEEPPVVVSGATLGFYDLEVDLTSGAYIGNQAGISWVSKISKGIQEKCGLQGVVKMEFPPISDGVQGTIMIDMWFDTPSEWVFNIGDSAANDGLSGDGNYQENDSEAEGYNHVFTVYGSDKSQTFDKVLFTANNALQTNLTVLVTNEEISWKSWEIDESSHFKTMNNTSLFALKGQTDSQGAVNYDIYFSMNRVIAGNYRSGSGLCKVAFKWLQAM
ncbi:hypothetical protein LOTGIDRAFT_234762 [Lottia gigantea]|uniref:Uncharacterized protein n=1 Tax=Lottia gigantea TaxID=225164 RepID=V3ZUC4_LOTGI|nr:hypothetical protein LOTGIDRAFT_234762 [Lottia gigantea]ESO87957.1 hypothetical protein LOTGIDRAFT_234762 [Lottia gigantea]